MSSSGDGDKPAQTGLVDMGDISFYNNPYNPSFNLSEVAPYQGSFSEIVLNVTWAQLQPSEGGPLTTAATTARSPRSMPSMLRTAQISASSSGCGAATRRPNGPAATPNSAFHG